MILVDSSVWVDHLRANDHELFALLDDARVLGHPFVTGEVTLGSLSRRDEILTLMRQLPQAPLATNDEVLGLVDRYRLHGRGIGWVDAHLLASTLLTGDAQLWTRDKRFGAIATEFSIAMADREH
jgi:predicted nucleic acid-binding protein